MQPQPGQLNRRATKAAFAVRVFVLSVSFLMLYTVSVLAEEPVMQLAMLQYPNQTRLPEITRAPLSTPASAMHFELSSEAHLLSLSSLYLEERPIIAQSNMLGEFEHTLRRGMSSRLRADDFQLGFGQLFNPNRQAAATQARNGTLIEEPACIYLKASFRF